MRKLLLSRDEAEWLVDLLEKCDLESEGTWRMDMASEIRKLFGMCTREESENNKS